jgi:tetratricopeptide (TPR) repeat protein
MKHFICIIGCSITLCFSSFAQQEDVNSLDETAKTYTRQGDYSNAIVVLTRALKLDPNHLSSLKDLAFTYYLQKNYSTAQETAKPLTERPDADVECYQILGLVYKALEERKECEKMYKQGIKRFPSSGVLYNEYGEMLWTKEDYSAIGQWEKGIEVDPNYSSNYYNASKYYFFTYDKVWSLVYGEIFINLESYSKRTPEIKNVLMEGYKKLFTDIKKSQKTKENKDPFAAAFLSVMNDQSVAVAMGITPESVTSLRSHFIQEWFDKFGTKFPYRLFEYHRQLLKEGMFDAYNRWIFGAGQDPTSQSWINAHADEYNRFITFQKGRIFKLPSGQYYHGLAGK